MTNAFIDLLRTAETRKWCVKPFCTTCGAVEYRAALDDLVFAPPGPLYRLMSQVTQADLVPFRGWQDAVWLAFMALPLPSHVESVLTAWVEHPATDVRLTDLVLFRIIKRIPPSAVREAWIDRGVAMALQTGDFSLVESTVLVLGARTREYPELMAVAERMAADSSQMRRVLRNALGAEVSGHA